MDHYNSIQNLKDGDCFIWPQSDYGKAEIWFKNEVFFLFEIPEYGGMPIFSGSFHPSQVDRLIDKVNSWT